MTLAITLILAFGSLIVWGAWLSSIKFNYIGEYELRPCQGRQWKKEFPNAKKEDIRKFLKSLVAGMDFLEEDKLKFCPNDELIEIYRSFYGGKTPFSDEMECERFILGLSDAFKMEPEKLTEPWKDEHVTLGHIFRITRAQPASGGKG